MRIARRHPPRRTLLLAFATVAGGACAYSVFAEPEPFDFEAPPGTTWQLAYSGTLPNASIIEYVPEGEDVESWSELVTVLRTYRMIGESRRDSFQDLQETREDECPGSTRWNLVEESDDRLIFESWAAPCLGFQEHYELAAFVDGTRDRIKLSYAVKAPEVDRDVREAWLATMRSARLGDDQH